MKKLFKIGISFLKLLFSNRPKVYWWSMRYEKNSNLENFGDFLTPYIVEKLSGKQPVLFSTKSKFAKLFKHSLMIGSIISRSKKSTLVWGSGIIKKDEVIEGGNFLAVRGPFTADRIKQLGFKITDKYGDPALLLPCLYNPKIGTKYKIGIIPHFFHFDELYVQNNNSDILFINLLTENVEDVIDQILSCEKIISTSLHGVIVSHAYQIPALWWKYGKLNGDDIKFYDYFASVNLDIKKNHNEKLFNDIVLCEDYYLPIPADLKKIKKDLIETYPYKLKKQYRVEL